MKYVIAVIIFFLVIWLASYAFNYVNVWIAGGIIVVDIIGLYLYINKQVKRDIKEGNNHHG